MDQAAGLCSRSGEWTTGKERVGDFSSVWTMIGRMMMMLLYLQRLGRCEECAGGNKPSKVALKSKMGNFDKVL